MHQDVLHDVRFPMPRSCPFEPPDAYGELRALRRIAQVRVPTGQPAWLVTSYDDVRRLLTDHRVSADRTHPNFPMTEPVTAETRRRVAAAAGSLVGLDHPEHGPRRRMLAPEFTMRHVKKLRPYIQRVVDDLIDEMLAGSRPVDLVRALAMPLPASVVCELLGMPFHDRGLIERGTFAMLRSSVSPEERQRIGGEMRGYVDRLVSAKEAEPTDDLLGRLVERNRETQLYDHNLLVGVTMLLLTAGFETTVNVVTLGVAALLSHPEQLAAIRGDAAAVPTAVEELLRYTNVVDAMPRVATADIEVGGVTVRAGDGLLLSFAGANRDEEVFPQATVFDTSRDARHHVAFGYGIHQCIGQHLARVELEITFRTLFTRIPGLRLAAPVDELPFKSDSIMYGIDELPVTW
jgi:cytochrome P450